MDDATRVLDDRELLDEVKKTCVEIANASSVKIISGNNMMYEKANSIRNLDSDCHWWVQPEAITGFLDANEKIHGQE